MSNLFKKFDYIDIPTPAGRKWYNVPPNVGCSKITWGVTTIYNVCGEYHVNASRLKTFVKDYVSYLNNPSKAINQDNKLYFMRAVEFPRRKLDILSKYSKVTGLSVVRKLDNADVYISNKNYVRESTSAFDNYNYNTYGSRYAVETSSGEFKILLAHWSLKGANYIYDISDIKSNKDNIAALKLQEPNIICAERLISIKDIVDDQWLYMYDNDIETTDISDLYRVIGNEVMDYEKYLATESSISKSLSSGSDTIFNILSESLPTYDIDKSIFYLSLIFKNHFTSRINRMNTNVKALYQHCQEASGFNGASVIEMIYNLSKRGYTMNIPLTYLLAHAGMEKHVAALKTKGKTTGFDIEARVNISKEITQHVYLDMDINDFNTKINEELNM